MIIRVDAQLPPAIAAWITNTFGVEAKAVRELGLRDAADRYIFLAAKRESAVVMAKDAVALLDSGEKLVEING